MHSWSILSVLVNMFCYRFFRWFIARGSKQPDSKKYFAVSQVSSGSFYNYFGSNDELAHALIDFEWSKLKAAILVPVLDASGDPITRLFWMSDEPNCAGCLLGNLIVELVEHDALFLRTFCSSFYGIATRDRFSTLTLFLRKPNNL